MLDFNETEKKKLAKIVEDYASKKGYTACGANIAAPYNEGDKAAIVGYKQRENGKNPNFPYIKIMLAKLDKDGKTTGEIFDTQINFCVESTENIIFTAKQALSRESGDISTILSRVLPLYSTVRIKRIFEPNLKTYKYIFVGE